MVQVTELKELDQFNKTTRWINTKNITEYKINEGSTPIIYSGNHSLARAVKTIITH
ncbi:hypothetical protein [Spiroplasma endosymbiont of Glossina fuscipes fuscipes]|uniref:hypothetical protein n=1 Tax=Spiroplasma endosymbiont of Glossina fuscipes fuscipes TaxID=2004463 RepID=UPI003C726E63